MNIIDWGEMLGRDVDGIYRGMRHDTDDKPIVGNHAEMLGVRAASESMVSRPDVYPGVDGLVRSGNGMSVAPAPSLLPTHRVPRSGRMFREGAKGSELMSIYRLNQRPFLEGPLTDQLLLQPDPPKAGVVDHGEIEPRIPMPLQQFRDALAATRLEWEIVYKGTG